MATTVYVVVTKICVRPNHHLIASCGSQYFTNYFIPQSLISDSAYSTMATCKYSTFKYLLMKAFTNNIFLPKKKKINHMYSEYTNVICFKINVMYFHLTVSFILSPNHLSLNKKTNIFKIIRRYLHCIHSSFM